MVTIRGAKLIEERLVGGRMRREHAGDKGDEREGQEEDGARRWGAIAEEATESDARSRRGDRSQITDSMDWESHRVRNFGLK
jgi:hypothetical protein